jgi:hypothetical protein
MTKSRVGISKITKQMSLKSTLNQMIKDRNGGIVTINEIEAFCHTAHYKLSNAERRLRPSESPNIERVMKNGAIIGYKYVVGVVEIPKESPKGAWWLKPEFQRPKQVVNAKLF